jgi:alpha-glucosidase
MPERRAYEIRLPGDWPPESVTLNGQDLHQAPGEKKAGWRYEGNTLSTIITVPRMPTTSTLSIHVRRAHQMLARRPELDGFAGAMTRLRESYDSLNGTWPLGWSPDELIDAMQSGDRLTYHPELAAEELLHYRQVLSQAVAQVQAMTKGLTQQQMETIAARVGQDWKSDAASKKITEYNERVARAAAEMSDINAAASQSNSAASASASSNR